MSQKQQRCSSNSSSSNSNSSSIIQGQKKAVNGSPHSLQGATQEGISLEGPTQLKGHQVAAGTVSLSPTKPLVTINFPPSRFARAPEVYVQLKVNGAPALGLTRLLLVTQERAVLYIHPNHCAGPSYQWELTSSPYHEVDWMAWLPF
ncbi:hypothetical protein Emed_005742 [Eimeria media]